MDQLKSLNIITGALMVINEERKKLRNLFTPHMLRLLTEWSYSMPRWIETIDKEKSVHKEKEPDLFDDVIHISGHEHMGLSM